ncbi:MAG: ATP-dependent Clp protease ATP-binding subunit ClpA [Desulfovibrionaceae bacterium]|nr:ATP-dependent Clp protease ATP-binding subunit ClpA [Desulfovibrionaceae bacterium]
MLNSDVQSILRDALSEVQRRRHDMLTIEHVLFAMTKSMKGRIVLEGSGCSVGTLREQLEGFFRQEMEVIDYDQATEVAQTVGLQRMLDRALAHVRSAGKTEVDVGDILVSIMEEDCYGEYFLRRQGVERIDVLTFISHGMDDADEEGEEAYASEKEGEEAAKNALAKYTTELTSKAREGKIDPLIGRDTELDRTIEVLCRRRKNNPLFVGEPGVGKTAMVEGLALRIADGQVPPMFKKTKIYALDMGIILAGTKYRGDFESRLKGVVKELMTIPDAILFIDEIHTLVGAGSVSGGSMDAANLLKPALASGDIRCIGSTTYEEFRNHLEKDRALARRFQKIDLHEPSLDDCTAILSGLQSKYASFHHVTYSDEVLRNIVDLSARHVRDRLLPDKAIDVLDEVGAKVHLMVSMEGGDTSEPTPISVHDVEKVVARMAGIPERSVSGEEEVRLANLESDLKTYVFGQDEAVEITVQAILRSRAGLSLDQRPQGSFLFYGPTGVGKTEIAKSLAQIMGVEFIRFDMSEYMEKHSVSRLVGTPPGYVGFDQGGLLTEAVRKAPYSVVLLDELEKAHPDIFNILLQVMDYGTLTDNTGRKTDFSNVILIMTSNAGAFEMSTRSVGFSNTEVEDSAGKALKAVEKLFSPEFRNRLDALVPFHNLTPEMMLHIVDKFLKEISANLTKRNVDLVMSDAAKKWFATSGYDPKMGARPLRRLLRTELEDKLARELLFGQLKEGGKAIFDVAEDKLTFEAKKVKVSKSKVKDDAAAKDAVDVKDDSLNKDDSAPVNLTKD